MLVNRVDKADQRPKSALIRNLDDTRLVTSACNHIYPENPVIRSGALDGIGFNYHHALWGELPAHFPGLAQGRRRDLISAIRLGVFCPARPS